ncbi:hypothetical protein D3C76_1434730 [compost metagenome]
MQTWITLFDMQQGFTLEIGQQTIFRRVSDFQHIRTIGAVQMKVVISLADQALYCRRMDPEVIGGDLLRVLHADVASFSGQTCVGLARLVFITHKRKTSLLKY